MSSILQQQDPEIFQAIEDELTRQRTQIELIASENFVSKAVLEAQGSIMTNKYAEGYPDARYYAGCEFVDIAEKLAKERACQLFGCVYANVQPHSGSQANQAVMLGLIKPGDTVLGMSLDAGGHLTHGAKPNLSGKWFNAITYGLDLKTGLIDYDQVRALALEHRPKMIIAGASAYTQKIDFKFFREVADEVGAFFLADVAHYAGLIVTGLYPNPFPHAHVVTTTTHKTLRGPRGGMVLTDDLDIGKKINSALFPGLQGGPLMHAIAAKAVAFREALAPEFKTYMSQVLKNAHVLAETLKAGGVDIVSGGTTTHGILVDLRSKNLIGKYVEEALEQAGMTCNKNSVPGDTQKPTLTSGLRLGSPAATSRGFKEVEFEQIGKWMLEIITAMQENSSELSKIQARILNEVHALCLKFPLYT
jgi:glycine hydroxymethyltransferase